jgi:hypothetical protein
MDPAVMGNGLDRAHNELSLMGPAVMTTHVVRTFKSRQAGGTDLSSR